MVEKRGVHYCSLSPFEKPRTSWHLGGENPEFLRGAHGQGIRVVLQFWKSQNRGFKEEKGKERKVDREVRGIFEELVSKE